MHIFIIFLVILAAWRWADWSRFQQFHATMLYIIAMNLLYFFFTFDYPLWTFESNIGIPERVLNLLHAFIVLPLTIIMFLSRFPDAIIHKLLYIAKWVLLYIVFEWGGYHLGAIEYHNGWSVTWSCLFVLVMFPMLRLHYTRPLIAYGLSIIIIAVLLTLFNVPWVH
ncbi:CBO0543 family protein [Lentibacillus sp.]|uniref:CBO0543 family protein n=1 Tax=Lentibacillus sp. TaxID=1925746 RepID=UPI002B4B7ED8|nr:CBO0543 family protein [Lentibacillus sp.]HLS08762.1 CBO0543 family protein [Lentibacillus sp.]